MSTTDLMPVAEVADPPAVAQGRRSHPVRVWARVALACALLAAAGGVRVWQGRQVDSLIKMGRTSPFPLASLPMTLGDWKGSDDVLDPRIAKATGCVDHIFRAYSDERTGVRINVFVLYGPPSEIYIHSPIVCYPANGFETDEGPRARPIRYRSVASPTPTSKEAPFSALIFQRGDGRAAERQEVYYTWYYRDPRQGRDVWTPTLLGRKTFERIPGMYKIHIDRRVTANERLEQIATRERGDVVEDPCEAFLKELLPELERRVIQARGPATANLTIPR